MMSMVEISKKNIKFIVVVIEYLVRPQCGMLFAQKKAVREKKDRRKIGGIKK